MHYLVLFPFFNKSLIHHVRLHRNNYVIQIKSMISEELIVYHYTLEIQEIILIIMMCEGRLLVNCTPHIINYKHRFKVNMNDAYVNIYPRTKERNVEVDSLKVADINTEGIFKTKRNTNPLTPRYTYDNEAK